MANVFDYQSLYTKLKVLEIEYSTFNKNIAALTKVSMIVGDVFPIYQYCQDLFDDNWIWSTSFGGNSNRVDLFFKHKEDALIFSLKFADLVIAP